MKKLLSILALLVSANPVSAVEIHRFNADVGIERLGLDNGHKQLIWNVVNHTSASVKINPDKCFEFGSSLGYYGSLSRELIICQERRKSPGVLTVWTEQDLDTLRHETHHLVQDCMGKFGDGLFDLVYEQPITLGYNVLGMNDMNHVHDVYKDDGRDEATIILEIEAFAVGKLNDPVEQIKDVRTYCSK